MSLRILFAALLLGQAAPVMQVSPPPVPPIEQARIVARFPHDPGAFTEGLLIDHGTLYESTGRERYSEIRRVDLATGRVLARATLPPRLFGEGIVAWQRELFSVTWHGGQGYRWSLPALTRTGSFRYSGEGWALTEDGHHLILSDGTPVLRFLDPATQKLVRRLTVTHRGRPVAHLNELEFINGEIFANVWMTPYIARIDPLSGHVTGWIDLSPLIRQVALTDPDSVPNGIAYDRTARRLFVTGKNWPTLYEIALPK